MTFISYRRFRNTIAILISLFFLSACSSSPKPNAYKELGLFDLLQGQEDRIHTSRVTILDTKISNTQENIRVYENKIRATKEAMANLQNEINSYEYLLMQTSERVTSLNQLDGWLIQLSNQIEKVEKESVLASKVYKGLKINKREFLDLKNKGHFLDLSWSDYLDILKKIAQEKKAREDKIKRVNAELKRAKLEAEKAKKMKAKQKSQQYKVVQSKIKKEKFKQKQAQIEKNEVIKIKGTVEKTSFFNKLIQFVKIIGKNGKMFLQLLIKAKGINPIGIVVSYSIEKLFERRKK
jgi:peptidoglycan hydrolase CwlO-like protein